MPNATTGNLPTTILAVAFDLSVATASTSCSRSDRSQYRPVPEAAAACGLPVDAIGSEQGRRPPSLIILTEGGNQSRPTLQNRRCLREWASAHGYVYIEPQITDAGGSTAARP